MYFIYYLKKCYYSENNLIFSSTILLIFISELPIIFLGSYTFLFFFINFVTSFLNAICNSVLIFILLIPEVL